MYLHTFTWLRFDSFKLNFNSRKLAVPNTRVIIQHNTQSKTYICITDCVCSKLLTNSILLLKDDGLAVTSSKMSLATFSTS